jgi:regulator of protease activity HflC (stomatin/prohibitin superfamily)
METKKLIKLIVAGFFLVVLLVVGLNCCASVGPTERGVMTTFGKPSQEILEPGLHFKSPIGQAVITKDLSPIEYSKVFSVGQDGALSKDMQTIGVTFTLYWGYDSSRIYEVVTNYKDDQKIYQPISTAAKAALKAEIGKYSVEEIVQNQSKITEDVRSTFETDKDISRLPIVIYSFKIDNWDWSDDYDTMIRKTMTRKQEVEQMKQEVALSEQAAQKQVKEAEAEKQRIELESEAALVKAQKEAEAEIAKARGEAEAKKLNADAEKYEALQIQQASQMKQAQWKHEENMLKLEAELQHEKSWNGQLQPNYIPITAGGTIVDITRK